MIVRHRSPVFASTLSPAFDRSIDRAFEQLTASFTDSRRRAPVVDASWDDGTLVLTVDLPGVPADAVSIEVAGTTLTLTARTDEIEWSRSLRLGSSLDPHKVAARHVDGRLTVTVGPVDAPEARRIEVDTTPLAPVDATPELDTGQSIETSSTD